MRDDEGGLIISETGRRITPNAFSSFHRRYRLYAKLSPKMTVHSLWRFSLNKHAKNNVFVAQQLVGHKSPNTTLLYVKQDTASQKEETGQASIRNAGAECLPKGDYSF